MGNIQTVKKQNVRNKKLELEKQYENDQNTNAL